MTQTAGGGPRALLLVLTMLLLAAGAAVGQTDSGGGGGPDSDLVATRIADGMEIARLAVPDGAGWCVLWRHSVQGFEVSDCYENRGGQMVLVHSHLPDFAAGLGHIPGRGEQVSDGQGGYRILNIDEAVAGNAYVLRPGLGPVDHRLVVGDRIVSLSAVAPRERVQIALTGPVDP